MKILYFNCNPHNNRCILEVEIEGEKIVLSFNRRDFSHIDAFSTRSMGLGSNARTVNMSFNQEDINDKEIENAKIELSKYLAERLFREYDSLKKLKK